MTTHEHHHHNATPGPARHGHYWEGADYTVLIDGLRNGRLLEDLAVELGRTPSAVGGRLGMLIPESADVPRRSLDRELWLRDVLGTEPGYDWWSVLRGNYTAQGMHLWAESEDDRLRTAWQYRTPLSRLAEDLGVTDLQIVRRCVQLGLAPNLPAVAEHLGATPGGAVDVRARLALDRAAAAVWILVVDGVGDRVTAFDQHRRHLSVHASFDAAMDTAAELIATASDELEVRYSIAERTVGENTIGASHHALRGSQDTSAETITG